MRYKEWLKQNWLTVIIGTVFITLLITRSGQALSALYIGGRSFFSISAILVTVFIFLGMFSVWVKEEQIMRHFGEDSGIRGLLYGSLLGTVFHGPQVSIFPLLKSLKDKGARMAVIVAVVSAFAIKIPMIPLELALMGSRFTVVHNVLLFATAPILGILMEFLLREDTPGK